MNNTSQNTLPRLTDLIQKGVSGAIVLPQNPTPDAVAAACALYLGLHKMGKNVSLACSTKVNYSLTASDKIQSQLTTSGDNLVISFPYTDGAIDKVDYNIKDNNFSLIVTPRQGFPKLDPKQVIYSYSGGNLDFVIVIDTPTLNSLGSVYIDNEKQFQGRDIINIDRHLTNSFFGTVNYVNKTSSSISELILKLLQNLGLEIDRDIATNLYAGISAATNNFTSYSVTADTFEAVATLLRMGAIKKTIPKPGQARDFQSPRPMGTPFQQTPASQSFSQGFNEEPDTVTPIEDVEKEPRGKTSAPQDWLKPKIFRGGGGLV
ncbi:DHH family phosphoesterase [Candidatus Roizmanbacteria bacterium]|nr:DHH family phosphoesterase [Candidatus Roizmanbacteria bacterium]